MATVNKDFKIKSGLIVEGTTATVNGHNILTESTSGDQYILNLIGGETLVKSVSNEFDVSQGGELSLDRTVVDGYYDAAGDAAAAQAAAEATASADATSKANAAQAAAEATASADATTKANAAQAAAEATASADATTKANAAESNANTYTDNKINDASNATDKVWSAYKTSTEIGLAQSAAETFATEAIANLVDSAPATLDTLNELAAALQDNPDIIGDLQNIAAGKQNTLTPGSNIDISNDTISVTGLDTEDVAEAPAGPLYFTNQRALDATSAAYDAAGAAATAEQNAKDYADALDTDDISEGVNNLYFTNARVENAIIDPLTLGTQTNISVTLNPNTGAYDFVAENGVAGSTTDDLTEGVNNLYFQNSRVYNAIEGSNIQPQSVDITWVRREEATWTGVATASKATVHSFGTNKGSVKYLVRVISGPNSHATEVLATTDSNNNIAVVEYGTIYTSLDPLATVTVEWNAVTSQYDLNVTTAQNNSEVLVAATLLSYND
jgi:chemotaxis protein histidine kinase CheA